MACGQYFTGGSIISSSQIWDEYTTGKQTYKQLSIKHKCSTKTIQRKFDSHRLKKSLKIPREVIVLMDTTYWGTNFGVMLFKDNITKENLLKYYIKNETNAKYREGIEELKSRGYIIKAIVCDGRRGLIQTFENIPVQMCQFHQVSIVRRHITKNPRMPAAIELNRITELMKHTDKESFEGALKQWYGRWESFLNERSVNEQSGKSYYTHKRLRSAYRSLKTNLKWLFTWYDYIELNIPNTTNVIEGHFADLKNKLRMIFQLFVQ